MVNSKDREKRTPLHWAAGKNALPCVDALLKAGADVHACDWAEHTPLHWACLTDALESAKAIMAAGGKTDSAVAAECAADAAGCGWRMFNFRRLLFHSSGI